MIVKNLTKYAFLGTFILIFTIGCSVLGEKKEGEVKKRKKTPEANMKERILARDNGGIFNSAKSGIGGTTYEFATSNVLWRASLQSLQDLPIASANYSGGILISDWIDSEGTGVSYKIQVNFKSNELATTSLEIKTFIKKCSANYTSCKLSNGSAETNSEIKNKILNIARVLKIEDNKKKKK